MTTWSTPEFYHSSKWWNSRSSIIIISRVASHKRYPFKSLLVLWLNTDSKGRVPSVESPASTPSALWSFLVGLPSMHWPHYHWQWSACDILWYCTLRCHGYTRGFDPTFTSMDAHSCITSISQPLKIVVWLMKQIVANTTHTFTRHTMIHAQLRYKLPMQHSKRTLTRVFPLGYCEANRTESQQV